MNQLLSAISIALRALWVNKLRSALTMLGIIIGVFAVVQLSSVVSGLRDDIVGQVESLGANAIFVISGVVEQDEDGEQSGFAAAGAIGSSQSITTITDEDIDAIRRLDGVESADPIANGAGIVEIDDRVIQTQVLGRGANFFPTTVLNIEAGREISRADQRSDARVAMITSDFATTLYPDSEPASSIGNTFTLNDQEFEVIAVVTIASSSFAGSAGSNVAVVPSTTARELFDQENFSGAFVIAEASYIDDNNETEQAITDLADQIDALLEDRHDRDDASTFTQQDIIGTIEDIIGSLQIALTAITAISLVVGGIGVMNIMLVSVTERTREIGLRKALGAKFADILMQFLIEAIFLTSLGGLIGLGLAVLGGILITRIADLPTLITPTAIILGLSVSVGIGLIFGLAPAIRAARKDPIEALRHE